MYYVCKVLDTFFIPNEYMLRYFYFIFIVVIYIFYYYL